MPDRSRRRPSRMLLGLALMVGLSCSASFASQRLTLGWDANKETDLAGYILYISSPNDPPRYINVGKQTTYEVQGLKAGLKYRFQVTAYNKAGLESDPSNPIEYVVPGGDSSGDSSGSPILITSQPISQTVTPGERVTFSVGATASSLLNFQWRFNGTPISGATGTTFTIPSAQSSHQGSYDVLIRLGTITLLSATAKLSVVPAGSAKPFTNGDFEAGYAEWDASGTQRIAEDRERGSYMVQFNFGQAEPDAVLWQTFATTPGRSYTVQFDFAAYSPKNNDEQRLEVTLQGQNILASKTASAIAGRTTSFKTTTLEFVADSPTTTITFRDVSPSTINVDSYLDNVRIVEGSGTPPPTGARPPTITAQPQSQSVQPGQTAVFSVSATGQEPLQYQWRLNGKSIPGATGKSYSISNAQASHEGTYDVVVSDKGGSVTSAPAVLTVRSSSNPASGFQNGSFESGYTGWNASGAQRLASIWRNGGTTAIQFNAGQAKPDGVLWQTFSTTRGESYIVQFDYGAHSSVNATEQRLAVTVTGAAELASEVVSAFGGSPLSFQTKQLSFVADGPQVTLTFKDVSRDSWNVDSYLDHVRVITGSPTGGPPVISSQPASQTVKEGETATFQVVATGGWPLKYQWRFRGTIIPGATEATYTVQNVRAEHAGGYDVIVSNNAGSVTSATATLSVGAGADNALVNGDFESGYTGWTDTGNQRIVAGWGRNDSYGVQFNYGQATPNGTLSQNFKTVSGQSYVVELDYKVYSPSGEGSQRLQVLVNGAKVLLSETIGKPGSPNANYETYRFSFVADGSSATITLRDASPTSLNVDSFVDNVRIRPGTSSAPKSDSPSTSPPTGSAPVAALIQNGGFQSGYANWEVSGTQRLTAPPDNSANSVVQLNYGQGTPNAMLSQTFSTTAGKAYRLEFDYGAFSPYNKDEQRLRVTLSGKQVLISMTVSAVATSRLIDFRRQSIQFVADSDRTTLRFDDVSPSTKDVDSFLDNVSVQPAVAQTAVNRPGTAELKSASTVVLPAVTHSARGVLLRFQGAPNVPYEIQRSTDLKVWTRIGQATADADGLLEVQDEAPDDGRGFYRAVRNAPSDSR